MVVAFDPQGATVLVAYCDHERGKPVGVFPATAADFNGRSPSTYTRRDPTYTRRDPKHGQGQVDTASCPSYFNVEWVPAGQVSYMPPVDPKERTSQTNDAYEPLDAVLRGVPALTEERRRDLTKVVKHEAENARVAIRNVRRDVMQDLKEMLKEKLVSEDVDRKGQEEVQKLTDKYVAEVDHVIAEKEKELMQV